MVGHQCGRRRRPDLRGLRRIVADALEQVERGGGDAVVRARHAAELTSAPDLLPVDLVVRDWARREREVAECLKRVDNQRMNSKIAPQGAATAQSHER